MMNCPQTPGMNITISIDLGAMMGNPGICEEPEPPCEDKLTYFNENNRPKGFGGAKDAMCEKLCGPDKQKAPDSEKDSGPGEAEAGDDKDEKSQKSKPF